MIRASFSSIILAGGKGRRLNGQDKGLIHYQGAPLISYALERARECSISTVISANRNFDYYHAFDVTVIGDSTAEFGGPLCGIAACAPHIFSEFTAVIACDMPNLSAEAIEALQHALLSNADRFDAAVYEQGNRLECGLMMLRTSVIRSLAEGEQVEGKSIKGWLRSLRLCRLTIDDPTVFTNLNRPIDF